MLSIIKAFVSGLFSGMAQDQSKRAGSAGTLARARAALAFAENPLTRFAAHAQMAKALYLEDQLEDMRVHKARALLLFAHNPAVQSIAEMQALKEELEAFP